ncbi:LpqB family beta-propeller domain-containing protein [Planotetraspora kaengkrachanensis]|uniref:Lipoprotein LpqB n=1 Tax=Planotetraspora kaengkrachanensis TaxID=575193 RepID=A0A8J3V817_9ACTN|nr:LpqB family beta-propeller domain-containing protein [Planotetraspora kaengkrachanensis]GIG81688.1 lipoprotein LpqB [Planotetraspora kaengkrachanensis]
MWTDNPGAGGRRGRLVAGRATVFAALSLALAAMAAACAVVPTTGSPRAAEEDNSRDSLNQPYVRMIATPPIKDASPEEIVKGFQAAMASFDDPTLSVARQYLTPAAAQKWNPWRQTTVFESKLVPEGPSGQNLQDAKDTTVTLKGTAVATIDSEGRYTPASGSVAQQFSLARADGAQWRIDEPPDARLLSTDDLKRDYRQVDLYYPPATQSEGLVVDRVWVPINPSTGVPETVVRRLLAGPTASIRNSVSTAFPDGTDLNQITVEGDTVVVDFTSPVESVSADRIEAMKAQLSWTLGDLVTGRTVEIRVDGEPFRGTELRFNPRDYLQFDPNVLPSQPQAYYMQGGKLYRTKEKGGELVYGAAGTADAKFSDPAISGEPSPRVAALVGDEGIWVTTTVLDGQWQRWIAGKTKDLTAPSWDRYGAVWTAERVGDHETRVWRAMAGQARRVNIDKDLAESRVLALRVSRDGARVAMITADGPDEAVEIGTIVRTGQDATITNVQRLDPRTHQRIVDIAWQDAASLLVLSKGNAGQELSTWSVMEGMEVPDAAIKLDAQAEIGSIVAAPPDHVLASADDDGEVRTYNVDKKAWIAIAKDGATNPVYPLG